MGGGATVTTVPGSVVSSSLISSHWAMFIIQSSKSSLTTDLGDTCGPVVIPEGGDTEGPGGRGDTWGLKVSTQNSLRGEITLV